MLIWAEVHLSAKRKKIWLQTIIARPSVLEPLCWYGGAFVLSALGSLTWFLRKKFSSNYSLYIYSSHELKVFSVFWWVLYSSFLYISRYGNYCVPGPRLCGGKWPKHRLGEYQLHIPSSREFLSRYCLFTLDRLKVTPLTPLWFFGPATSFG